MRDYPKIVRSAILDAVYPPQANLDTIMGLYADRALREVFCGLRKKTERALPTMGYQSQVLRRHRPPCCQPRDGHRRRPYRSSSYAVRLSGDLFIDVIFVALYSTRSIPDIPT